MSSDTLASLVVKLSADIAEYTEGMENAEKTASSVTQGLSSIGGAIVVGGIAVAGAAIAGMTKYLWDSVEGAAEADKIQAQLINTIGSTGSVTGVTVEQINDLATAYSKLTPFEDDSISAAGEVLSRFKEISSDAMPDAIEETLNLATVMGSDAPQAAMLLGKALADPTAGLARLKMAGVVFTDKEEAMIKKMVAAGDMAGAQALILDKLKNSIGGAAEAAGMTFSGQMTIMKNTLGNISDTIGAALLPVLTDLVYTFTEWVNGPDVQAFITGVAESIGTFAQSVVSYIPVAIDWIKTAFGWLMDNQGVIIAVLAAIGVAVVTFAVTSAGAIWTAISPILAAIAVLALVAGAVYLLYLAWVNDFGGIRTFLEGLWTGTLQPIFQQLVEWFQANLPIAIQFLSDYWTNVLLPAVQQAGVWIQQNVIPLLNQLVAWLKVNIPIAIQFLSDFWTNTLLPAIQTVINWITTTLIPTFLGIVTWLQTNIPAAIQAVSDFWTNTLLPAIQSVWSWINTVLMPFFSALADFLGAVLGKAVEALAGLWQNVLQPALEKFYDFVNANVVPVIQSIVTWLGEKMMPVLEAVGKYVGETLTKAFEGISTAIQDVTAWLEDMAKKISNLDLPDWLTPGSPTPFEIGLRGIADALDDVSGASLPAFESGLDLGAPNMGGSGKSVVFNFQDTRLDEDQLARALERAEAAYV